MYRVSCLRCIATQCVEVGMGTWFLDSPQRLSLDEQVNQLDVWFVHGKVHVVGTDGPARIEVTKVGRKGITVTLSDGVLSVRHDVRRWSAWGGIWWFGGGKRNFTVDVIIAVPPQVRSSLTVIAGDVVASGLRAGTTVDVM